MPIERKVWKVRAKTGKSIVALSQRQYDIIDKRGDLKYFDIIEAPKQLSKEAIAIDKVSEQKVIAKSLQEEAPKEIKKELVKPKGNTNTPKKEKDK